MNIKEQYKILEFGEFGDERGTGAFGSTGEK